MIYVSFKKKTKFDGVWFVSGKRPCLCRSVPGRCCWKRWTAIPLCRWTCLLNLCTHLSAQWGLCFLISPCYSLASRGMPCDFSVGRSNLGKKHTNEIHTNIMWCNIYSIWTGLAIFTFLFYLICMKRSEFLARLFFMCWFEFSVFFWS